MGLWSYGRWALRQETSSSIYLLLARVSSIVCIADRCLRLGALVATGFSQCLLITGSDVTMPLREETDKVDLVGLTAVDRLEIVVTVDRVESVVIGELLFSDCLFSLQAKDSIDVFFLLDVGEFPP